MKKIITLLMRDRPSYLEIYIFTFFSFLGCLGVLIGIFMLIQYSGFEKKEYYIENLGYLGSYFSGLTSIFILIATIIAVYFSYNTFQEEVKRVKRQHLEDRFYHLIQMHRQNVSEMMIEYNGGRIETSKAILNMFRELEVIVKIFKIKILLEQKNDFFIFDEFSERDRDLVLIVVNNWKKKLVLNESFIEDELYQISFLIMFIGCGDRSSKILKNYLIKYDSCIDIEGIISIFSDNKFRNSVQHNQNFKYKVFGGHQSRLGHYYRNMFHIVKFIDSSADMSFEEKLSYIKNFRVQLNTFEQALLLVNGKTIFGKQWSEYIIKYKLVKNIPKDFFGKNYWFDMNNEVKKLAEKHSTTINKEYNQTVGSFMETYFEYNKHEL